MDSLDEDKWKTHPIKEDCTIAINIASLRQKGDACSMILCYVEELKEGFNPYILEVAQLCSSLLSNPHIDDVRSTGASMIPSLLQSKIAFIEKYGGDRLEIQSLFKYLLLPLLSAIRTETNTQILCLMLLSLREVSFPFSLFSLPLPHPLTPFSLFIFLIYPQFYLFIQSDDSFNYHIDHYYLLISIQIIIIIITNNNKTERNIDGEKEFIDGRDGRH